MALLVTLQQAKDYLRTGTPAGHPDDAALQLVVDAAESLILDYLSPYPEDAGTVQGWGPGAAPPIVPQMILFQTGEFWRFRGDDPEGDPEDGPHGSSPVRRSTIASERPLTSPICSSISSP